MSQELLLLHANVADSAAGSVQTSPHDGIATVILTFFV